MSTTRRLIGCFLPHRGRLALALVLLAAHSAVPGLLVLLVEVVLDDLLIRRDEALLPLVPLAVVGLYAANGALGFARGMLTRSIAFAVITRVRHDLFEALLRQDAAFHQARPTGELLSRLTGEVDSLQYGVSAIVTAIQKPLTLLILLLAAFRMNPMLTLVAAAVLPLVALPISRFGRSLRERTRQSLDNLAALSASAAESLAGIRTVKLHGAEAERLGRFERENQRQRQLQMQAFAARLLPGPVVELIAAAGAALVLTIGGRQVLAGEIQPGELVAFLLALGLLNQPLKGLAEVSSLAQRATAGAETVFGILDRAPAVPDRGRRVLKAERIELCLEGVCFDYGQGEVLRDLDLTIRPGQLVALVGASGSGKSTLAALVGRLFDPVRGRILVNGHDLREYRLDSLRRHLGLVSQDAFLFNDTVAANIALGCPDASRQAIVEAAKIANAHDFIQQMPAGYDTPIDELGQRLSGGQRQRICIARAVLRKAPLLILDEATSALDAESEHLVQQALDRLRRDRTVLCIAHRLSTIRDADEILVLEQGRVVERGRHADLLEQGGSYARLVRRQEA